MLCDGLIVAQAGDVLGEVSVNQQVIWGQVLGIGAALITLPLSQTAVVDPTCGQRTWAAPSPAVSSKQTGGIGKLA
jgi:hypothetical protein